MLELKLDIVPYGDEKLRKNISTIKIINTGTHKDGINFGNYIVEIENKTFMIKNHPRKLDAWCLAKRALDKYIVRNKL